MVRTILHNINYLKALHKRNYEKFIKNEEELRITKKFNDQLQEQNWDLKGENFELKA